MGIDSPNFQGANLRQVVTQGDQAALIQNGPRDTAEFQSRMGGSLIEKGLRARDQATGASDLIVHRQEDQAEFSAGDALNGGHGGGGSGGEEDGASPEKQRAQLSESEPQLESLPDPFSIAYRFGQNLRKLGKEASSLAFRDMDRRMLAGLSGHEHPSRKSIDTYRQQAILTGGAADAVRMALEAALRESLALIAGTGELDLLRKLLSLVRQGCRPEAGPGRDLSSLAGHMLVRISREEKDAISEALGLLSHLVGSIREWRAEISRGILPSWATR